jgi:hypothetical protein
VILRASPLALAALASACVVVDGPTDPFDDVYVGGSWHVSATPTSSTCGTIGHEPFGMAVVQNGDLLQFVVEIQGFGPIRYDGWIDGFGDFRVDQVTVFASRALESRSTVDGRFGGGGRTLFGTEIETITDLRTGAWCRVYWRWTGSRS